MLTAGGRACRQAGGRAARCRCHKAANRSLYQPSCTTRLGRVLGRAPPQTAACIPTHALANGSLPARPLPLSTSPCYAACRRVIVMPCRIRVCPPLPLSRSRHLPQAVVGRGAARGLEGRQRRCLAARSGVYRGRGRRRRYDDRPDRRVEGGRERSWSEEDFEILSCERAVCAEVRERVLCIIER